MPSDRSEITTELSMGEVLRRQMLVRPDAPALLTDSGTVSYRELHERSDAVARGLIALGLRQGDRVAGLLGNDWHIVVTWLACAKAGMLFVPINSGFSVPEVQTINATCHPSMIVTTSDRSDVCAVFSQSGARVVLAGATGATCDHDALLEGLDGPSLTPPTSGGALVTILFTSGSTGQPKGVMHDHLFWNAYAQVGYAEPLNLGPDTRYLSVMPLFHINGLGFLWSVLYHGGMLVQHERFSATRFWSWARDVRANNTFIIGAMANMLLACPPTPHDREHELRVISTSAMVADKAAAFERRFDCVLLSCYGMTEGGGCIERPQLRRRGSSGLVTSGAEMRVTAADGSVCPAGVAGRIEMRDLAGGLARGYWDAERGRLGRHIRDAGWFRTGDFGVIDEDGFLFFEARERDRLRRAGENISAVEIEDVLRSHPAVLEAAVIGIPDPVVDEEVKVFVRLADGADVSVGALAVYASTRLAKFKQPRYWEIVSDLPRTPTQRVKKHELSRDVAPPVVDVLPPDQRKRTQR